MSRMQRAKDRRYVHAWAVGVALLFAGCAGSVGGEAVAHKAIGSWENLRLDRQSSTLREAAQTRRSPSPELLTLRKDGSFEASFSPSELAGFQRAIRDRGISTPLTGSFVVRVDFAGIPWIQMTPGAPNRRLSVEEGILVLHKVGQEWSAERYRRVSPAPGS